MFKKEGGGSSWASKHLLNYFSTKTQTLNCTAGVVSVPELILRTAGMRKNDVDDDRRDGFSRLLLPLLPLRQHELKSILTGWISSLNLKM